MLKVYLLKERVMATITMLSMGMKPSNYFLSIHDRPLHTPSCSKTDYFTTSLFFMDQELKKNEANKFTPKGALCFSTLES